MNTEAREGESNISIPLKEILSVDPFTALRFTATGAPIAARRIRILLMNQHVFMADNIWNEM
jgi:hypothetical protein